MKFPLVASLWFFVFASPAAESAGRDVINIVGSSTVFPFAKVVAERFGKSTQYRSPTVESTGTGGGFKEFCRGLGIGHPDIVNASRRIKPSEFARCQRNGVKDIIEVLFGYDGIVLANSVVAPQIDLSRRQVYLALAKMVPDPAGREKLVKNPHGLWSDIDPQLPDTKILVFGPPTTSGTRDAYVELVMEGGCVKFEWLRAIKVKDPARYKRACHLLREDGAFVEAGENDNLIVQKLRANPRAMGIFGFSFLDQNSDKVKASAIDGSAPTFATIADGRYPISRPLYFYVKKAHVGVVPGIRAYLTEFTSERSLGDEGYLADKGMVPLGADMRNNLRRHLDAGHLLHNL